MKAGIRKIIIIIIGIMLNVLGRLLSMNFNLPFWFDMVGTFIAVYYAGLWGGIVTGVSNNIIASFFDKSALIYSIVSIIAAALMYAMVKKDFINRLFKAFVASFWMGIACTIFSTPLNVMMSNGYSGNYWGDTLVDMLCWYDVPIAFASLIGEVFVEIEDKQICVMAAFIIIKIVSLAKSRMNSSLRNKAEKVAAVIIAGLMLSSLLAPFTIKADEQEIFQDNFVTDIYNNANGMYSSEANVICETDDGYIWIGSYAGLTRYDGSEFEFITEGGLVNVVSMMTDSSGRLWIGTNDSGIARYENGNYSYFTEEDGLSSNSVRCFAEDESGNVYVGTSDKICVFDSDDNIKTFNNDITFAKAMTVYKDTLVVVDNNGGLYALNGEETLKVISDEMKSYFYYCIAGISDGLMVGTESGELFKADVTSEGIVKKSRLNIEAEEISAVFEDSHKRMWIATDTGFGYLTGDEFFHKMNYLGFDSSIVYFHEDYQGNIWAASTHYGVLKLSQSTFLNIFEKAGVEKDYVNAVTSYKGNYYCGMDDGLIVLDNESFKPVSNELERMLKGIRVRAFYTDNKGRLWICTYSGLFCYSQEEGVKIYSSKEYAVTSDRFRCITQLSDGTIAAGTADGINFIKDGKVTATVTSENGLANTQILSIVEGDNDMVLAGSDGSGIYVLSEGRLVKKYTTEDGLSSNIILRIVPHEDGYFIVTSNALCHLDNDGNIKKLENFPYFNNYDVIVDGEKAYITCSAGLYETEVSKLCTDSDERYQIYSAQEGLFSGLTANSWNFAAGDGSLFLCSNNGVIVYKNQTYANDTNIKFGITHIENDKTLIKMTGDNHFVIPADTHNLSIYASVRNYGYSDLKVRFFVKELDDSPQIYDWDEIEPIKIFKPQLLEYTVCMQLVDETGETVLKETVYKITREMQPWEKPVFKTYITVVGMEILIFTLVSIFSMIIYVTRKNQLEIMQVDLENKVSEQTKELKNQQKIIKKLFVQTVTALSEAVDAKDRYTSGHSKRVAEYARRIAERMGKSKDEQEEIYRAGLLHDIGKIRIPAEIINKPGKLTDEEYNIIKIHPVTGFHILRGISGNDYIAVGAKYHHERYDGKGYPNGLAGDKIPEIARILGVADAYDAMASYRSYRDALPQEVVRSEILKGRGTQFDPYIADIMLEMIDEDKDYSLKQTNSLHRKILTVDDEPINNKIIAHIMRDEPMYEIISAQSGKEALEMLDKESFDLILLDLLMPEMDGLETLQHIRKKYKTPVVIMTSDKTLDTSVKFSALGCDDYITKPVLPLLMKEVIHNMTERTTIE